MLKLLLKPYMFKENIKMASHKNGAKSSRPQDLNLNAESFEQKEKKCWS